MSRNALVFLTVFCTLCSWAIAQQISCQNAAQLQNVNMTKIAGTWFEVARAPQLTSMACIEVDLQTYGNGQTLGIDIQYVNPQDTVWQNLSMAANVTINPNINGVPVSYSSGGKVVQTETLKLLKTDYDNYALVCGYTNATDASSAFGILLTRDRTLNAENVTNYANMANKSYANFDNMTMITQSSKCFKAQGSSASAPLPMFATMTAVAFVLLKYFF